LDPGVCFVGAVSAEPHTIVLESELPDIPRCLRFAGSEKTDEVCRVSAADEYPAAVRRVADHLSNPANRLRLDFRGDRRECKRADVLIYSSRQ